MAKKFANRCVKTLLTCVALSATGTSWAAVPADSVAQERNFMDSSTARALVTGMPLVTGGLLLKNLDRDFRNRQSIDAAFTNNKPDYYLQFAPAVTLLTLKVAGVESATPWSRMLVADAFSVVAMAGTVQLIKHTTTEARPDCSNNNSFPSGHTATAFMTATMLHHEYGNRYPWLSALGYATATATGFLRVADNHHWVGDAMAGAGIGIISTELGYLLSDLVFHRPVLKDADYFANEADMADYRPTFVGFYASACIPVDGKLLVGGNTLKVVSGCSMGVECAYFFSRNIGIGGKAGVSDRRLIADDLYTQENQLDCANLFFGAYLSLPLSARFSLDAKAFAGYNRTASLSICTTRTNAYKIPASGGFAGDAGVSVTWRMQQSLAYRLFCEYESLAPIKGSDKRLNSFGAGAQLLVTF